MVWELVNGQTGELVASKIIGLLVWRNLRIQDTTTGNPRIQRLEINNPRIQEKFVFRKNPTTQIGIWKVGNPRMQQKLVFRWNPTIQLRCWFVGWYKNPTKFFKKFFCWKSKNPRFKGVFFLLCQKSKNLTSSGRKWQTKKFENVGGENAF